MSDPLKKAGIWPWVVAMLVGLPVLYVASFGPGCWFSQKYFVGDRMIRGASRVYWPFGWILLNGPRPIQRVVKLYATANFR